MERRLFAEISHVITMIIIRLLLNFKIQLIVYNGAIIAYTNLNGDRTITHDEITSAPIYYGGLTGPVFDIDRFVDNNEDRFRSEEF